MERVPMDLTIFEHLLWASLLGNCEGDKATVSREFSVNREKVGQNAQHPSVEE
jgi:hypothetical protein